MKVHLSSLFQVAQWLDRTGPFLLPLPLSNLPQEDALSAPGRPLLHWLKHWYSS